jgi:hypothetical protein
MRMDDDGKIEYLVEWTTSEGVTQERWFTETNLKQRSNEWRKSMAATAVVIGVRLDGDVQIYTAYHCVWRLGHGHMGTEWLGIWWLVI